MKKCLLCLVILFTNMVFSLAESQFYYGSKSSKNELSLVPNKIAVRNNSDTNQEEFLHSLSLPFESKSIKWKGENMCIIEADGKNDICRFQDSLRMNNIDFYPVYLINNNIETIVLPEIAIRTNPSTSIESILSKYGMVEKENYDRFQMYSVPKDSDVIKIANQIYETGLCEFSYPHFLYSFQLFSYIPNDAYFQYQIAFHNIGQVLPNGHSGTVDADIDAPEAWEINKGSSDVIVAVFDEGVTNNHPDLPSARQVRLNGSNYGWGNPNDPSPILGGPHGDACASVIAATMDNNEGVAGIAPNCKIMPIKWDECCSDEFSMANGINFAVNHGAHIISCSWGINDTSTTLSPAIINAIEYAIGHNVIVVFAAGNTANHVTGNNGYVTFPANANIENLITVGASDRYDQVAKYSPKSPLIDFVAPSHRAYRNQLPLETYEMWTMDIPDNEGYNPVPYGLAMEVAVTQGTTLPTSGTNYLAYTGYFGGTSYSCPVVAGVVALMLSIDPNLTPAKVYDILKRTCDKVGGYTYTNGRCNEMGYGRVNAFEAVVEASGGHIQGPQYVCDTTKYYLWKVPTSGSTISWSISNAMSVIGTFSIVGPTNQDTVYVVCTNAPVLPPLQNDVPNSLNDTNRNQSDLRAFIPKLCVSLNNGTTSKTYKRVLNNGLTEIPTISASNTLHLWQEYTQRTFTITNCTAIPDSLLRWKIVTKTPTGGLNPLDINTSYAYGRTLNYTPRILSPAQSCTLIISASSLEGYCKDLESDSLVFTVYHPFNLLTEISNDQLKISIVVENEASSLPIPATLNENSTYTFELWHTIYGIERVKKAMANQEWMDIKCLPLGTYTLLLKENGNIITKTKLIIQ